MYTTFALLRRGLGKVIFTALAYTVWYIHCTDDFMANFAHANVVEDGIYHASIVINFACLPLNSYDDTGTPLHIHMDALCVSTALR